MNDLLFGSIKEREALENVLAFNQIKKCDNEIAKYSEEIKEQKEEMMRILKDEEIDEEYVEKIHKYKNLLRNIDVDNDRISQLDNLIKINENKINDLQNEVEDIQNKLERLKSEIFETNDSSKIIDCQNEIENYSIRLNDLNNTLENLIESNTPLMIEREYLVAKNSNQDFNAANCNKISIETDLEELSREFETLLENLDLPVRENVEFCQKKITNREIEIEKYNDRKNKVIESFPNAVKIDLNSSFADLQNLLTELNLTENKVTFDEKNIFDDEADMNVSENNEITEEKVEQKDEIDNNISIEEDTPSTENEVEDEKEESASDIIEETESNEEVGSVSYVLSDGESLMNIAEKVYPSKDNWKAIYYFNKDSIDKYLVSNGISNDFDTIEELADDTNLFAGIKLEIPTDYNYKI